MKKKTTLLLAIIMMLTFFAACAKTDGGATAGKRTDVNIPLDSIGATMDAHAWTLRVDYLVLAQKYETLYYFEDDGTIQHRLATSHEVSDDGLTYTFKLREGVVFQDGSPFTSKDVLFSFNRCVDNAWKQTNVSMIEMVTAPDDMTVAFTIKSPSSLFLRYVTEIFITSEKVVTEAGDKYGIQALPSGTGPYTMTKYDVNSEILMEANAKYWRDPPAIKTIRFVPMNDASTQLIAFEKGEFDFCAIPAADWASVEGANKYTTVKAPGLHMSYLGINVGKEGPLQNQKVRQAIAYACDKVSMVAIAADGFADVAEHLMRVGFIDGAQDTDFTYDYNVEKAKELLAEAGYADGFHLGRIEAITAANGRYVKMAQVLQENLAAIGITSDIIQGETASMLPAWKTDRNYDIFVSGFTPTFSYYELKGYVHSKEDLQVQLNLNPDIDTDFIDSRLDTGLVTLDQAEAFKLYKECEEYLLQVAGYVPIMHVNSLYAWNSNLTATVPVRLYHIYDWSWK